MRRRKPKLEIGRDYIIDTDGRCVFTRQYLEQQGSCCGKECRYCPYEHHGKLKGEARLATAAAAGEKKVG